MKRSPKAPSKENISYVLEPLAVSILQGCQMIGLSRSSIYREIEAGRIKALKAGVRTLLPVKSLRAWLSTLPKVERPEGRES